MAVLPSLECIANPQTQVRGRPMLLQVLRWATAAIGGILLMLALPRIDFHADEAIYLQGIPVNASNDSGLVFHTSYLIGSFGHPTPMSARVTSLLWGVLLIVSLTGMTKALLPTKERWATVIVPLALMISYQGIFSILRVRPEISWFAMASLAGWSLAELRQGPSRVFRFLLFVSLLLLPMNHMLSWFACLVLAIYLCCFGRVYLGTFTTAAAGGAMIAGVILNRAVRTWMVTSEVSFLPDVVSAGGAARPPVKEFFWNVFWNSPNFLNDSGVAPNLWQRLYTGDSASAISHCMVATVLWAVVLPLPLFMKTWESRFVASVPAIVLALFFLSGYYNPTYAPLMAIYAVGLFAFVALDVRQYRFSRFAAASVLLISLLNGASFLSTRILNHGPATFFAVESRIRQELSALPPDTRIAVAERFQSVLNDRPGKKTILFKDPLPADIECVVLDNYDFDMYRFVPEYDRRREEIETMVAAFDKEIRFDEPVYRGDRLNALAQSNGITSATQGSWFFRNSVNYGVSLLTASGDAPGVLR